MSDRKLLQLLYVSLLLTLHPLLSYLTWLTYTDLIKYIRQYEIKPWELFWGWGVNVLWDTWQGRNAPILTDILFASLQFVVVCG